MKKIIILAVVSFVLFLFVQAPASLLLPYFNNTPYDIQVKNIEGSIFAATMQTTGEIDSLSYRLNFSPLLLANLSFDVVVEKGDSNIQGVVVVNTITLSTTLKHLIGTINLALFEDYIPELSAVEPRGQLFLKGVDVSWDDFGHNPIPQNLSGKIDVLKFQALEQDFGDYTLQLTTKTPTHIVGKIDHQQSAQVSADIEINLLDDKKQLQLSGVVSGNTPNTKAILRQFNIGKINQTISY